MQVERHVFGSRNGYQTLAHSSSLSASECKALQGFAFGTPYDPALRASLERHPAYWSRPVGPHKRAVTRVMKGEPDDAGRSTLLFISAVVSANDWDRVLQGDAAPLLRIDNLWRWDSATPLGEPISISVHASRPRLTSQNVKRVLGLVSMLERAWVSRQPVVIREDSCSFEEILMVERLLPPQIRRTYSAVYRGISCEMPVSLNCLAQSVPADSNNPIRAMEGAVFPYAKLLAREGLLEGRIPSSLIAGYQHFSKPVVETSDDDTGSESMMELPRSTAATPRRGVFAALLALALILGATVGWLAHRPGPNPWQDIATMAIAVPPVPGEDQATALLDLEDALKKLPAEKAKANELDTKAASQLEVAERARDTIDAISAFQRNPQRFKSGATDAVARLDGLVGHTYQPFHDHVEAIDQLDKARSDLKGVEEKLDRATAELGPIEQTLISTRAELELAEERESDLREELKTAQATANDQGNSGTNVGRGGARQPGDDELELTLANAIQKLADDLLKKSLRAEPERKELAHEMGEVAGHCRNLDGYQDLAVVFEQLPSWITEPRERGGVPPAPKPDEEEAGKRGHAKETTPADEKEEEAVRVAFEQCLEAARALADKRKSKREDEDRSIDATPFRQAKAELRKAMDNLAKL